MIVINGSLGLFFNKVKDYSLVKAFGLLASFLKYQCDRKYKLYYFSISSFIIVFYPVIFRSTSVDTPRTFHIYHSDITVMSQ